MYHCADGCEFLGRTGQEQLAALPDEAAAAVVASGREYADDENEERPVADLDLDEGPTAYLFRCRHCGAYCAYCDFT
jgi:uncharacterized protein CbrC (UPF0167 family)